MYIFKPAIISNFLIKVTARCNLNCDYCYVFNHADQSWKTLPSAMSENTQIAVANRLAEHVKVQKLKNIVVIFHGGEPMLLGSRRLVEFKNLISDVVGDDAKVDFCMQTNGTMLSKFDIELFDKNNITVSLSLDGPKHVNDIHRLTPKGNSSFEKVMKAYELLKNYPKTFTGVIAVLDPRIPPKETLDFFSELAPPAFDFLLPDSNYISLPPGRDKDPDVYIRWLIEAFDLWFRHYNHLKLRLFDNILMSCLGYKARTDFFGFGDINLLSVETDGKYHILDVLKITKEGESDLDSSVFTSSIYDVACSEKLFAYRNLQSIEGLSDTCKVCPVVEICGGGSVPHRFDGSGYKNPTVYCSEMLSIIQHAQETIKYSKLASLRKSAKPKGVALDLIEYSEAKNLNPQFDYLIQDSRKKSYIAFKTAIDHLEKETLLNKEILKKIDQVSNEDLYEISNNPLAKLWARMFNSTLENNFIRDLNLKKIEFKPEYLSNLLENKNRVASHPLILRHDDIIEQVLGSDISFESSDDFEKARFVVSKALDIVKEYNQYFYNEIKTLSPLIVIVKNNNKKQNNFISFSDNMIEGCIFLSAISCGNFADPFIIAESIIHEHRHQKLYLLEKYESLVKKEYPYVNSPWKDFPRPVSALFHAIYVFYELKNYWSFVLDYKPDEFDRPRSSLELCSIHKNLLQGIQTLLKCGNLSPLAESVIIFYKNQLEKVNRASQQR